MPSDLAARADALRAKYKTLESVRGSGHHDDDRNPTQPHLFLAPQRNGLPRASEHVVGFFDYADETVTFPPADAGRVLAVLAAWVKKAAKADLASLPGTERKLVLTITPRLAAGADGRLVVRLSVWNDVLYALQAEGMGVSGAPIEPDGTTP